MGFIFTSADDKQPFQVHLNGFTTNRLGSYPAWNAVRDEARRLWNVYRERNSFKTKTSIPSTRVRKSP